MCARRIYCAFCMHHYHQKTITKEDFSFICDVLHKIIPICIGCCFTPSHIHLWHESPSGHGPTATATNTKKKNICYTKYGHSHPSASDEHSIGMEWTLNEAKNQYQFYNFYKMSETEKKFENHK